MGPTVKTANKRRAHIQTTQISSCVCARACIYMGEQQQTAAPFQRGWFRIQMHYAVQLQASVRHHRQLPRFLFCFPLFSLLIDTCVCAPVTNARAALF